MFFRDEQVSLRRCNVSSGGGAGVGRCGEWGGGGGGEGAKMGNSFEVVEVVVVADIDVISRRAWLWLPRKDNGNLKSFKASNLQHNRKHRHRKCTRPNYQERSL